MHPYMWFPVIWLLSSPLVLQQRLFSASLSCWSIISPTTSVGERVLICVGERAEETIVSLSLHGCESCCSITTKQKLLLLVFLPNSCRQISCRIFWPTETLLILFSIYNMYIKDKHFNFINIYFEDVSSHQTCCTGCLWGRHTICTNKMKTD